VKFYKNASNAGRDDSLFAIHATYCSEKMIAAAKKALAEIDTRPLKTAEGCHMVGCAHLLHAKISDPVDVSRLRTAELRLKNAINRGHTDSSIQLAESAALRQNLPLCNQFLRMYVDGELCSRGRFFENMKLNGEKYASSVLKTREELKYSTALMYCSVARDLCSLTLDNVRMVEKLTSPEHIKNMMEKRLRSLEEEDIMAQEDEPSALSEPSISGEQHRSYEHDEHVHDEPIIAEVEDVVGRSDTAGLGQAEGGRGREKPKEKEATDFSAFPELN